MFWGFLWCFFWIFWDCFRSFAFLVDFCGLLKNWIFGFFGFFFWIFVIFLKVTKASNKCCGGYYWAPKISTYSMKSTFFCPKGKKASAEGQRPPQELEVSPHTGLYLLVFVYRKGVQALERGHQIYWPWEQLLQVGLGL